MIIMTRQFVFITILTALAIVLSLLLLPWNLAVPGAIAVLGVIITIRTSNRIEALHRQRFQRLLDEARVEGTSLRLHLPGLRDSVITADGLQALAEFCQYREQEWSNPQTTVIETQGTPLHVLVYGEITVLNFKVEAVTYRVMCPTMDIGELTSKTR